MTQKNVILYYKIKVYIKTSYKNVTFKSFQYFLNSLNNKKHWLHNLLNGF